MKKNMYPYLKRKKNLKKTNVRRRISELQSTQQKQYTQSRPLDATSITKNSKGRKPFIPYPKKRWKLGSAIFLCTLGIVMLVLPTIIVLPFTEEADEQPVSEGSPQEPIDVETLND